MSHTIRIDSSPLDSALEDLRGALDALGKALAPELLGQVTAPALALVTSGRFYVVSPREMFVSEGYDSTKAFSLSPHPDLLDAVKRLRIVLDGVTAAAHRYRDLPTPTQVVGASRVLGTAKPRD